MHPILTPIITKQNKSKKRGRITRCSHNFSAAKHDILFSFADFYVQGREDRKEHCFHFWLQDKKKIGKKIETIDMNEVERFRKHYMGFNVYVISESQAQLMLT